MNHSIKADTLIQLPGKDRFLARKFIQALGLRICVLLVGFATSVLLARILGPTEFGYYLFAFSLMTLIAIPVQAGMPMLITKKLPQYDHGEQHPLIKGLLIQCAFLIVIFSAIAIAGINTFNLWWFRTSGGYEGMEVVVWGSLLIPLIAFATLSGAAIRSLQRHFVGQAVETALRQALLLALIGSLSIIFNSAFSLDATQAMILHILAGLATALIGWLALAHTFTFDWHKVSVHFKTRQWLKNLAPLAVIAGMTVILGKTDIIMLRILAGADEVAHYYVAAQFGMLVFISAQGVRLVNGPLLAREAKTGNRPYMQRIYSQGALFVFLTTIPTAMILILFGRPIIELIFGAPFIAAYAAVIVFSVGYMLQALFGTTEIILKIMDHEATIVRAFAVAIVANILINAILIPPLGIFGAALASMTVTIASKLYLSLQIYRKIGIRAFAIIPRASLSGPGQ
ncbi:lipopolysaccharide biosynthesis protein [Wenzhouxiangella sediminis]|nr:oligosaccharide flippase family protein [Wenzhouxiangella sediminis]